MASPPDTAPLTPYGWDDRRVASWATAPSGTVPGRVVRADRGRVVVQAPGGTMTATANPAGWPGTEAASATGAAGEQASDGGAEVVPTTGDWVAIVPPTQGDLATVAGVLPRTSRIARVDALGRAEQVLAANVDTVAVVHGLDRPLKAGRIDRSLVLAWDSGATPTLVLTKADLLADVPDLRAALAAEAVALAGDATVHVVSSVTGEGLPGLAALLRPHRTLAVLGESGAGKSRLVNRLVGRDVQATGEVRAGDAKGRHTTVTRDLVVVPAGGVVVDTPGLRSLGLWDAAEGLALAYADIDALAIDCRFRDCQHRTEPGCAVRAAVARGELPVERLERYLDLHEEAAEAEARREKRAQQERGRPSRPAPRPDGTRRSASRRPR